MLLNKKKQLKLQILYVFCLTKNIILNLNILWLLVKRQKRGFQKIKTP